MTLPDPSRVPGAEPLSPIEAKLAEILERADCDGTSWMLREHRAITTLAREALEALRAERTAAPASGEVDLRRAEAVLDVAHERFTCQHREAALVYVRAALASALTPQRDVEALIRWNLGDGEQVCVPATDGAWVLWADVSALARVPPAPQPVAEDARPSVEHVEALTRYWTVENSDGGISASLGPSPKGEWLRRKDVLALFAAQARSAGRVEALEQIAKETAERIGDEAFREVAWEAEYLPTEAAVIILAALQRARDAS